MEKKVTCVRDERERVEAIQSLGVFHLRLPPFTFSFHFLKNAKKQRTNVAGLFRQNAFLGAEPQGKIIPGIPILRSMRFRAVKKQGTRRVKCRTKNFSPFLGLCLLGNACPASYAGLKQRFFSAGFGWLNWNKPIRKTHFGIIWCNSKQRSNSVVSSPSIRA